MINFNMKDIPMFVVDKENYEAEVVQCTEPVLVDIWGPQCAPCLALLPQVEELASTFEGKVKFCKLNATENRRLCMSIKVMGLPSFLFYKNGEIISRLGGDEVTIEAIKAHAEGLL